MGAADVGAANVGVTTTGGVSSACAAVANEKASDASSVVRTELDRRRFALL
jgi:hypothetical protein